MPPLNAAKYAYTVRCSRVLFGKDERAFKLIYIWDFNVVNSLCDAWQMLEKTLLGPIQFS